jgi:hypothetical protein
MRLQPGHLCASRTHATPATANPRPTANNHVAKARGISHDRLMNCRLLAFCMTGAVLVSTAPGETNGLLLDKDKVHSLIREVAAKIEARYKSERPDADGLLQRVEEALSLPAPAPPNKSDRPQQLAAKMMLMTGGGTFNSGIRSISGAVFDNTEAGFMQRYQDLESASTKDAAEAWRWLEMADAARFLNWQEKKEVCTQRAQGAARALISREPKSAEAHALLGLSLEWSAEKLAALQTSLRLDPKQPLALNELLYHRVSQALEAAVLRRGTRLEEESKDVTRDLFDHPLSDAEAIVYDRQASELQHELTTLFTLAEKRGDLRTYISNVLLLSILKKQNDMVTAASRRHPEEEFESFQSRTNNGVMNHMFSILADEKILKPALKLADGNPEATGAILLMAIVGDGLFSKSAGRPPSEALIEITRPALERLTEMAAADESPQAARSAEAVFLADFARSMMLDRKPALVNHLMRAIQLDPFRQRTQNILMLLCTGAVSKDDDLPAAAALSFTNLALMPNLQSRKICAAITANAHDWPTAHRQLDACLRKQPDDLNLLNQKAVTFLRESQSKAAQKKATIYFQKIESLLTKMDERPDASDLKLIATNHILFLIMGGKNDEAREELKEVLEENILSEQECADLTKLLP